MGTCLPRKSGYEIDINRTYESALGFLVGVDKAKGILEWAK